MKLRTRLLLAASSAIAVLTVGASAQDQADAYGASADNPYAYTDGEWVMLSGEVDYSVDDRLALNYGGGVILVELDDEDMFNEASLVEAGDHITVRGRVDENFTELQTIEADVVYVQETGTLFHASPEDEEGASDFVMNSYSYAYPLAPGDGSIMSLTGIVQSIDGEEFEMISNGLELQVDTGKLPYNPLGIPGAPGVDVGDRIRVTGEVDADIFERNEIQASSIVTLYEPGAEIPG